MATVEAAVVVAVVAVEVEAGLVATLLRWVATAAGKALARHADAVIHMARHKLI